MRYWVIIHLQIFQKVKAVIEEILYLMVNYHICDVGCVLGPACVICQAPAELYYLTGTVVDHIFS